MNSLVAAYRQQYPTDPRSNDQLTSLFGEAQDADGRYSSYPDFVQDWQSLKDSDAQRQAILNPPPGPLDELGKGFKAGVGSLKSTVYGAGALAADFVGADSLKQSLLQDYQQQQQDNSINAPQVPNLESIHGVGDAAKYAAYQAGQLIPNLGEALVLSAAGGLAGGAAGTAVEPGGGTVAGAAAGTATGLVGGFLTRDAAESLLAKGVEKLVPASMKDLVESQLQSIVERKALSSIAPETEGVLADAVKAKASKLGNLGASFLNFSGLGAGSTYGELANDPNVSDSDAKTAALISGALSGGGGLFPAEMTEQLFGKAIDSNLAQSFVARTAQMALKDVPIGAVSMAMPTIGSIAANRYAHGTLNDPLTHQELSEIVNSAAIGGVVGGAFSPLAAAGNTPKVFDPAVERHFADVTQQRRAQIDQLKYRMQASATPDAQDIAAARTLTPQEQAYYQVSEPAPPDESQMEYQGGEMPQQSALPTAPNEPAEIPTAVAATPAATPASGEGVSGVPPAAAEEPQETPQQAAMRLAATTPPPREDPAVSAARAMAESKGEPLPVEARNQPAMPPLRPSDEPIKIQKPDGTVIDAVTNGKTWDNPETGDKIPNVGRAVETKPGESMWSDGPLRPGEKIITEGGQNSNPQPSSVEIVRSETSRPAEKVAEGKPGEVQQPAEARGEVQPTKENAPAVSQVLKPEEVDVENRGTFDTTRRGQAMPARFTPKAGDDLLSESRPVDKNAPPSQTHRVTDIIDHKTGEVHQVSTFARGGEVRVTKFDESLPSYRASDRSVSLKSVTEANDEQGNPRYEIIGSNRTTEPTEYLHAKFPDRKAYEEQFAKPVEDAQRQVQSKAGAVEEHVAEGAQYRPEKEQTQEAHVMPEFEHEPENIDLKPDEVSLLLQHVPEHASVDDMADLITDHPELRDLFRKIALADKEFFPHVEEVGLRKALKDYGYKTDEEPAGQVEPKPAADQTGDISNTGRSVPEGTGRPKAGVDSGEDRAGEQGQKGAGGNQESGGESDAAAVAQKYRVGKSPQLHTLVERLPQSDSEKELGEQPVTIRNDKTGETQTVMESDLTPVKERTAEEKQAAQAGKTDLDTQLRKAGLDPSVFPDADSKREALRRQRALRKTEPEPSTKSDSDHSTLVNSIHQAAADAGIDVKVVDGILGSGAYDPANRTLTQVLGETVGRQDVKTAFHEVMHDVVADETPERQEMAFKAIDSVSDAALGLDMAADTRIRESNPANLPTKILSEERLVDTVAERLTQQGFNPDEAKTISQRFVRTLKDLYLKAAMAVQKMLGMPPSAELALRYFENRTKMLLAGDTTRQSYIDWIGAGKPSSAARHQQWFESTNPLSERFDENGNPSYSHQPDMSLSAARYNLDNAIRRTIPDSDPKQTRTVDVEKRASVFNHLIDTIKSGADVLEKIPELAKAAKEANKTPEAYLRSLLRAADPREGKLMLADAKESDQSSVVYDPERRWDQFKAQATKDSVLGEIYRNVQALISKSAKAKGDAEESLESLTKKQQDLQKDYEESLGNYTDWEGQTNSAVKAMRKQFRQFFSLKDGGVIGQQLKALDPEAVLKDYAPVFQKLFTGDQLKGEKLFNLLETLAKDPAIDFSKPVSEIRKDINSSGLRDMSPYGSLLQNTKEARALLATISAFAKTHAKNMAEIELRSLKDGGKRSEIEKDVAYLQKQKKEFPKQIGELAKTAKLEERFRAAHVNAIKELRRANDRLAKAQAKIKAADAVTPVFQEVLNKVLSDLKLRADFVFRHDASYNVPDKSEATSDEVVNQKQVLKLDSSGKVTQPDKVEGDLSKMAAFMRHREELAAAGDENAKDAVYQGVKQQFDEIARNKNFKTDVGPAQRWMTELAVSPVGKRVAEAFGTPIARSIDRMVNHYTTLMNAMRPEAERIGRRNDQLEDAVLRHMTGINRDYLRDNLLNPAKKFMQNQHDLEEAYADQPEKLKNAIYRRMADKVLSRADLTPYIKDREQMTVALRKLLEFQHESNQYLLDQVQKSGLGVLDPKLKVFNPATGEYESGVRRHLQKGAYTFSQKLGRNFGVMVNALRNSGFAIPKDGGESQFGLAVKALSESTKGQPNEAALKAIEGFFNHPEYGDQVNNGFMRAIAEMEDGSLFNAPAKEDAITKPPANPELVEQAYNEAKGNPVEFAERMYDLHGGHGDRAEYVQETLQRINGVAREVQAIYSRFDRTGTEKDIAIRGMTADALIDAREIEHLPGDWFDYHSYDQRDVFKTIERIASQVAFGRGQERLGSAFDTLASEVTNAQARLAAATEEARRANPAAKDKAIAKLVATKLGKDYPVIKKQAERGKFVTSSVRDLSDYFRRDNAPDGTLQALNRFAQGLGNLMVNQPSSAIAQLAALYDLNLKYGAGRSTLGATAKTIGAAGKEVAYSLAQAIGVQMKDESQDHRLFTELGYNDATAVKQFGDAFDRLQGESTGAHFYRGINDLLGTGLNRLGDQAEHTIIRPAQPFITSAILTNKALTYGIWNIARRQVGRGLDYFRSNPEALADPNFKLDSKTLGLKGAEADTFDRFTNDMSRWGIDYNQMVRDAQQRSDKTMFTNDEAAKLYSMMMAEVSNESGISSRPMAMFNNPIIKAAAPLLGWSFSRVQQIAGLRLNTEGQFEMKALARGLAGLGVIAAGGLGLSAVINQYYQSLLGKQRNLRPVVGGDAEQSALGMMENLNRIGTFGMFGDLANSLLNTGGGADNRMISVDQRVVALSAIQSIQQAIQSWINQGSADYVHVGRPLAQAVGLGGALQYMQLANHALGLDNAESRVNARLNAQNYLRVAGRILDMDVRDYGAGQSNPTPLTPYLSKMELAAYAGNMADFQQAYREALEESKSMGDEDPQDRVKRSFTDRNPLRNTFITSPTAQEYKNLLAQMPSDGATDVDEAVRNFNRAAESIGARPFEGRREPGRKTQASSFALPNLSNALKAKALEAVFR